MYSDDELRFIEEGLFIQSLIENSQLESHGSILDLITGGLGGLGGDIHGFVQNNLVNPKGGNFVAHILNLFIAYVLGRKNILYGLLWGIANAMGINIQGILNSLVSGVASLLGQGKQIAASDVDSVGTNIISSQGGDYSQADDTIINMAAYRPGMRYYGSSGWMSKLGKPRLFGLIVRILGWILKAFLFSAGLMIGGKMIAHFMGISKPESEEAMQKENGPTQPASIESVPTSPVGLKPSGAGTKYHQNDEYTTWIVPLQGSIADTLVSWATEIYPQLRGKENLIRSTPSFNIMVNKLSEAKSSNSQNYLMMPKGVHRRIDIVNGFAGDVAKKMNQGNGA